MTEAHKADLCSEFLEHYMASETRGTVDRYLDALAHLVAVPRSGQIEEGDER